VLFSSVSRAYTILLLLLTLVITARVLGPDGRGMVAAVVAWAGVFATVGNLSIGQSTLYHVVKEKDENWLPTVFGSLLFILATVSFISWGGGAATYILTGGDAFSNYPVTILLIGAAMIPFMVWNSYGNALMVALNEVTLFNKMLISTRTIGFVFLCLFLFTLGVQGVLWANLISISLLSIFIFTYIWSKKKTPIKFYKNTAIPLLKNGLYAHPATIGSYLIFTADVIMINYYMGATSTGYYQLAVEFLGAALLIIQSIATVLQGHVSEIGANKAWKLQRKYIKYTMFIVAAGVIVAYFAIPYVLPVIVGDQFGPSLPILQIMLFTLLGHALSCLMASQWIARGLLKEISAITVFVGAVNVFMNYILIPEYGMYGALFASIIAALFAFIINICMLNVVNNTVRREAENS